MIIRRLIVPLTVAVLTVHAGQAFAQGGFPAPLPGQGVIQNDSAFPPVNAAPGASLGIPSSAFPPAGATPFGRPPVAAAPAGPPDECMKGFVVLRDETEKRGKVLKAAGERHAQPDEACKLIEHFSQAEFKMLKYVEGNSAKCGIPPQIADQLKTSHKATEGMQKKVCTMAQQIQQKGPAGPSLSEILGSSAALPEATPTKKGGSTFDTLNGNVLTR